MEPRFGYDFSLVRVHSGTTAEQSAQDVNANAYTVGRDIVFASGQYAPNTADGRKLIAHELVHVVQQGGDRTLAALQRKDRTHWRDGRPLFYETKAEAQVQMDYVQSLGKSELLKLDGTIAVAPDGPVKEKEGWTFFYFPLTEAEANAAKDTAEAKLNKKNVFTVESDKRAASFYIRPKCPDAAPEEAGWTPWSACFPTEDKAKAQVKKFQVAHIEAKIGQLQKDQFFVLFQPLTKAEAEVKGETEAKTRGGFAEGMFTVEAKEVPELGGWAYELKVGCPKGFKPLGQFEITSYFTAVESDFPETPTEKDPCIKDTFRERFLHNGNDKGDKSPFGVDMEGNGLTLAGKFIHYKGKNCYEEVSAPLDARDQPLIVDSSVAVDDKKIRLGTRLQIQDVGLRTAADVGGKVKVNRIDLFKGLFNKAKDTTLKDKLVCQEEKP